MLFLFPYVMQSIPKICLKNESIRKLNSYVNIIDLNHLVVNSFLSLQKKTDFMIRNTVSSVILCITLMIITTSSL